MMAIPFKPVAVLVWLGALVRLQTIGEKIRKGTFGIYINYTANGTGLQGIGIGRVPKDPAASAVTTPVASSIIAPAAYIVIARSRSLATKQSRTLELE